MADYELIFDVDELADEAIDEVYDRYDAIVAGHGDRILLTVTAPGPNAVLAAQAAVRDLESIDGVTIGSCYEDLVSKTDIARRVGVSPQAVGQWIRGNRHRANVFPKPYNLVSGGAWLWGEVDAWLRRTGLADSALEYPCQDDYAEINRWIKEHRASAITVTVDIALTDISRRSTHREEYASQRTDHGAFDAREIDIESEVELVSRRKR